MSERVKDRAKRSGLRVIVITWGPGTYTIVYPTGREVATGNTLLREDTLDEPDVVITPMNLPFANADSTGEGDDLVKEVSYTLVLTDPDAPSKADPKYRQFRHWVVRITNSAKFFVHILRIYLRN